MLLDTDISEHGDASLPKISFLNDAAQVLKYTLRNLADDLHGKY